MIKSTIPSIGPPIKERSICRPQPLTLDNIAKAQLVCVVSGVEATACTMGESRSSIDLRMTR